jgi:hypothetical protein
MLTAAKVTHPAVEAAGHPPTTGGLPHSTYEVCDMQRFNLRLTKAELDALEYHLEIVCCDPIFKDSAGDRLLRDVLTKIIVTKVEAEEPFVYVGAYPETDRVF